MLKVLRLTRMVIISGKGGVGKTTAACSVAQWFANKGFKTILISTDPAPSIGDCLNIPIGKEPVEVKEIPNLWALEIDGGYEYAKLYEYIKTHNKNHVEKFITERGIPGMNEMAALFKMISYLYNLKYDVIVVDTAPNGHTVDMLKLPKVLEETIEGVKSMLNSISLWKQLISGNTKANANKKFDDITYCVNLITAILQDTSVTHFNLVCIPEAMALREDIRTFNILTEYKIPVRNIILNHIQQENKGCVFCTERHNQHMYYLNMLHEQFDPFGVPILQVKHFPREVVGIKTLQEIGSIIMRQLDLEIEKSCKVMAQNGGYIVATQIPYVQPEHLSFRTEGNILYMIINFGLHEEITNALAFPRPIMSASARNVDGKLVLYVS